MYNFPVWLLDEMNKSEENPFLAHNILEDEEWNIKFIDTDYRPLDFKQWIKSNKNISIWINNVALNKVGDWITKKALADIKQRSK